MNFSFKKYKIVIRGNTENGSFKADCVPYNTEVYNLCLYFSGLSYEFLDVGEMKIETNGILNLVQDYKLGNYKYGEPMDIGLDLEPVLLSRHGLDFRDFSNYKTSEFIDFDMFLHFGGLWLDFLNSNQSEISLFFNSKPETKVNLENSTSIIQRIKDIFYTSQKQP